jgi:hypothetical protein
MARHSTWAVAGSRVLTRELSAPIERWCWQLSGTSARVAVGCCRGVDYLILSCLPPRQLRVFAAFAPDGAGAGRWSAVAGVQCLARGLPVVVVPLGFPVSGLPPLGTGVWVPAALPGVRAPACRWACADV